MEARVLKAYAGAVSALALAGGWYAIAGDPFPQSPEPSAAPAPSVATTAPPAAQDARHDLALARAYRDAAAQVRGQIPRPDASPPPMVAITPAAPVAETRSS